MPHTCSPHPIDPKSSRLLTLERLCNQGKHPRIKSPRARARAGISRSPLWAVGYKCPTGESSHVQTWGETSFAALPYRARPAKLKSRHARARVRAQFSLPHLCLTGRTRAENAFCTLSHEGRLPPELIHHPRGSEYLVWLVGAACAQVGVTLPKE